MTVFEKILDDFPDEKFLTLEGFNDAVIGLSETMQLVYDKHKIIEILQKDGMTEEEAIEHYDFNIAGAYMGESTPIYVELYNK